MLSTGDGQCKPPVEIHFYRRLALTTACRNTSTQEVVNTTRLYKAFVIFIFIIVFYIFCYYFFIAY